MSDIPDPANETLTGEAPAGESPSQSPPNPGWFKPGNSGLPGAPLRHGGRSRRVAALALPEQAEARAALTERTLAIVGDLGGDLTQVAIGMVERHARLELVADFLFENVQRLGPLSGKGRTRACLSAWLAVVDRLQKSAVTLGLERRSKRVDLAQAFAQQERERS